MAETAKANDRRIREGFFEKFCQGSGIDIGCGKNAPVPEDDRITSDVEGWDKEDGDATFMEGVPDEKFDFVNASYILEHLWYPTVAIQNWFRIVKSGGFLIICVPHRDLYEKKRMIPSSWNPEHKLFFLPDTFEEPGAYNLSDMIRVALLGKKYKEIYIKTCSEGHTITDPKVHSDGEYQIEAVLQKE